jgi:hypothetical protein
MSLGKLEGLLLNIKNETHKLYFSVVFRYFGFHTQYLTLIPILTYLIPQRATSPLILARSICHPWLIHFRLGHFPLVGAAGIKKIATRDTAHSLPGGLRCPPHLPKPATPRYPPSP